MNKRPLVMGVLNVTPDSFSDGGKYTILEKALDKAREMAKEGADIIDVGGESTRPGAKPISLDEEMKRVIPVVKAIVDELGTAVSVDSYKAPVARAALESGAVMINDISGLRFYPDMVDVASEFGSYIVVMHMKGTPQNMQEDPIYEDVVREIELFFIERLNFLEARGIDLNRVFLDPGIGFGKRHEDNLRIIRAIPKFKGLGMPVLIGPSRKSFIGEALGLPVNKRLEGTLAVVSIGVYLGADAVRVHDVAPARKAAEMAWALRG